LIARAFCFNLLAPFSNWSLALLANFEAAFLASSSCLAFSLAALIAAFLISHAFAAASFAIRYVSRIAASAASLIFFSAACLILQRRILSFWSRSAVARAI
jgi:hypothetical protein